MHGIRFCAKESAARFIHLIGTFVFVEIEQLADHGITLPPNMQGLAEEQIEELKLKDEWAEKCRPKDYIVCKDDVGRRNGEGNMRPVVYSYILSRHAVIPCCVYS